MDSFKGTSGKWQVSIVSGICIGIETEIEPGYSQMIVNTILPDTDRAYAKEKKEILANAHLIAAAPTLLFALQLIKESYTDGQLSEQHIKIIDGAINKALEL